VLDFVALLSEVYGRDVPPVLRGEFRPGDFRHLVTDAAKLRALGWKPQVTLREGLQQYAVWIQSFATVEEYFSEAERLLKETRVVLQSDLSTGR
jgi:dTDP-L-rhamnose 4-epimerase